jgi:hypothetical protein
VPSRAAALRMEFVAVDRPQVAGQRPIARSEPVIPLEIAEFDSDGLAGDRQRVIPTLWCRSPPAAIGPLQQLHRNFSSNPVP